jgi:hypothetical protein
MPSLELVQREALRRRIRVREEAGSGRITTLLIALTALFLVAGGVPAMMNNACKTSHHSWCRPEQIGGHSHSSRPPRTPPAVSS